MELVCVDNHVLIWAIKNEASSGQEEMVSRTKRFIKHLDETNCRVLVPAVVIAEFLMNLPSSAHVTITTLFQQHYLVAPFDIKAASKFSEIWQANHNSANKGQIGKTRESIKIDDMIVATAVAWGADCIYSHDPGVKAFSKGFIDVKEIPVIAEQGQMFIPPDGGT